MAADIAFDHAPQHVQTHARPRRRVSYELIAIWILWLVNVAWFVPYAVETGAGILRAVTRPAPLSPEAAEAGPGGVGFLLIDVAGVIALGLVLALGLYWNHRRNHRIDPVTEAATREVYEGGEDPVGLPGPSGAGHH